MCKVWRDPLVNRNLDKRIGLDQLASDPKARQKLAEAGKCADDRPA